MATQASGQSPVVIAIDFGTTYSGYAFSFAGDGDNVYLNTNWASKAGAAYFKTPTCVLTELSSKKEHSFLKFGFEAQEDYNGLVSSHPEWCLYDKFKMELHRTKQDGYLLDKRGTCRAPIKLIFEMALTFIMEHVIEHFKNQGRTRFHQRQIAWVLTVPAIWSDNAKRFMREAAHGAGLIEHVNSDNLHIGLEPETASLFCRQLDVSKFDGGSGRGKLKMPEGTIYILLDAGGGTIDITTHQVLTKDCVTEVLEPTGGPWGGATVNAAFWDLFNRVIDDGSGYLERLKQEQPKFWWDTEMKFEHAKRMSSPESKDNRNIFTIGIRSAGLYGKMTGGADLAEVVNRKGKKEIFIDDDYSVIVTKQAMDNLFKEPVNKIVQCVNQLLMKPQLKGVKYLIMVGGFSHSPYLRLAIKEACHKKVKVLIPEDPALAIMKGAVTFGKTPDCIRSRIARRTYGVATVMDFNRISHKPSKRINIEGKEKCKDIFHVFIRKGDSVKIGDKVRREFAPKTSDSKAISFELLAIDSKTVEYSDDSGVEKVGYIEIPMADTSKGKARRAEVTMLFGGTELNVTAKDLLRDHVYKSAQFKT